MTAAALLAWGGCGCLTARAGGQTAGETDEAAKSGSVPDLEITGSMPLSYAQEFTVDYCAEGYSLVTIHGDRQYLVVEEGFDAPENVPGEITVLEKPLDHIYAASSSSLDYFRQIGALDSVTMTSTKAEDWSIDQIREKVAAEDIIYVGKYSAPDYEYICDEGCSLALENTMIFHAPEVSEMLGRLGIGVMIDYSSYETEPLGRLEWIRLYGFLTDHQESADTFFESQVAQMRSILEGGDQPRDAQGSGAAAAGRTETEQPGSAKEKGLTETERPGSAKEKGLTETERPDGAKEEGYEEPSFPSGAGRSVVFFYIGTNGTVNIRREEDYVSRMIEMAGGTYALHALEEELGEAGDKTGSIAVQMESFYSAAKDADILIYNGTLGEQLQSLEELTSKSALLEDFKAVKTGDVYCSGSNLFQQVTGTCSMITDFYRVLHDERGESDGQLTYLRRLR